MRRLVFFGVLGLLAVALVTAAGGIGRAQEARPAPTASSNTPVQRGDQLQVVVFGHAELSRTVAVQRDGSITYLPIGRIIVAGQTVDGVAERIASGLEQTYHMREPRVLVSIASSRALSEEVYILGYVRSPGSRLLPQGRPLTLTQLLALAGGFPVEADLRRISVQRFRGGTRTHQQIDLSSLERTGVSSNDIDLQDGDTVYVPSLPTPGDVSVLGQVRAPGALKLDSQQPLTVLRALARVGDMTRLADRDDLVLLRGTGSNRQRTVIDVDDIIDGDSADITLQAGDILVVGERGW